MKNDDCRRKALFLASAVLAGTIGVVEGCKRLSSLAFDLVPDWTQDEDFVVFGGVDSEADDLPTGSERQYWSKEALLREDEKIRDYESRIRDMVRLACSNVIRRFGGRDGSA